jgi:hypothetical protein
MGCVAAFVLGTWSSFFPSVAEQERFVEVQMNTVLLVGF